MSPTSGRNVLFLWMFYMLSNMEFAISSYVRPPGTCVDSVYAIPGHTMCIATSRNHPIHKADQNEIMKIHDDIRSKVIPRASNMLALAYVYGLDREAQIWADQCTLTHDEQHLRNMPGRYTVGQNILVSKTNLTWQQVIQTWANENNTFHYGQTNDINLVGNYTQLVMADTASVGCGVTACGGVYFYVCNYAPGGNFAGKLDTPYKPSVTGQGADDCPNHLANDTTTLCDCDGLICLNGGTVNLTTCECNCPPDNTNRRYEHKFCELMCEPKVDPVSCQSRTKSQCNTDADTFLNCPWLCNACPYSRVNYTQGDVPMPWTTLPPPTSSTKLPSVSVGNGQTIDHQSAGPPAKPFTNPSTAPTAPSSTVVAMSPNGQAHSQTGHDAGTNPVASLVMIGLCMTCVVLM